MIKFPSKESPLLVQNNRSDVLGTLWSSMGLDIRSNLGTIRLSPRLRLNTSTADVATMGCPVAFRWFDTKIFAIAGARMFANGGLPSSSLFSLDASSAVPTTYTSDESDMEIFNGALMSTTTDGLWSKAADGSGTGAYTQRDTLNTGTPHVMTYFKKYDRLYYSNASDNIISITTAWSPADPGVPYALSLAGDSNAYTITCLRATSSRIWIGILDRSNEAGRGKVLEWDGQSQQITNEYLLNGQGCMALAIDTERDVPYAMDSTGILYKFNGNGFTEYGRLPVNDKLLVAINDPDNERFIHPNGLIVTKDGTILALVNNANADGTYNENFHSGIYEFGENGSCIHRYPFTYTPGSTSTITDYGQSRISRAGGMYFMNIYSTSGTRNGTMMAGATFYTDSSSTSSGIFFDDSNDTVQKSGYLITTKIFSPNISDVWSVLGVRLKRLLASTDKIVVKYRTHDHLPTDFTMTWTTDDTFTTATSLVSYSVGDEVEVLQGKGSGKCAHITAISESGGTYTVVLDEHFTNVGGTSKGRAQKWIKILTVDSQVKDYHYLRTKIETSWIQLKVWMLFTGKDEVNDIIIDNSEQI